MAVFENRMPRNCRYSSLCGWHFLRGKGYSSFKKVGCSNDSSNTEAFPSRKDWQRVLSVKKNLQKLNMKDIGLIGDIKVFINHSSCPYYCVLWLESKALFIMKVSNGTVKVKITEIRAPISITHADDFTKNFPDIDISLNLLSTCLHGLFYKILSFSLSIFLIVF